MGKKKIRKVEKGLFATHAEFECDRNVFLELSRIAKDYSTWRVLEKCEPQFYEDVNDIFEMERENIFTLPASSLYFFPLFIEKPAFGYILFWTLKSD